MINKLSTSKAYATLFFLVIAFRFFLDYGYTKFVYPLFSYNGFTLDYSLSKLSISWVVIIFILLLFYFKRKSPLVYIYFVIYTLSIIPTSSYYALSGNGVTSFWITSISFIVLLVFLTNAKKNNITKYPSSNKNQKLLINLLFLICLINLLFLVYYAEGNYVLSFSEVYEFRSENSAAYSGFSGYINNWSSKVFIPFIIAYGLVKKNKNFTFLSVAICISFFIFTGHKSTLMPIILCFFMYKSFDVKSEENNLASFAILCLLGLLVFSIIGILKFLISDDIQFSSVFLRRTFFIPVWLNSVYFEMFSGSYSNVFWSNSLLSFINPYPYGDIPITKVVGSYVGSPESGANTGFIASGFMQSRYVGVLIYVFIILIINLFLSRLAHRVEPIIFNSVLVMPFITIFVSSDLPVGLFTHGLLIAVIIMTFYSGILKFNS